MKKKNRLPFLAFTVLTCLVSFTVQAAAHPESGVIGVVFIGPTCPVIVPGIDCGDVPYQTGISIYSKTGRFITEITTDEDGLFEVVLRPGHYILVPDGAGSNTLPYVTAQEVVVRNKQFTPVVITYDSGLR
jgi:hypothetical protein